MIYWFKFLTEKIHHFDIYRFALCDILCDVPICIELNIYTYIMSIHIQAYIQLHIISIYTKNVRSKLNDARKRYEANWELPRKQNLSWSAYANCDFRLYSFIFA